MTCFRRWLLEHTIMGTLAPLDLGGFGQEGSELTITLPTKETVADVLNNLESMTQASWNASMYGRSGTMGMSFSNASQMSGAESMDEDDTASVGSGDSGDERDEGV